MTIRSTVRMAARRDSMIEDDEAAPADAGVPPPGDVDRLAAAVPHEIIVLYTSVLGLVAGTIPADAGDYLPLRWILFAFCLVAIVVLVPLSYRMEIARPAGQGRNWPVLETVTAAWAFAVWGLAVPASPVYVLLRPPVLPVVVGCLVAVGAFVLTYVLAPLLRKPPGAA